MKAHVLRVFVDDKDNFGNPVGIVIDENHKLSSDNRQKIASNLGFSESVFINKLETGDLNIFNPIKEVKFAGHALVGTAYFLGKTYNKPITKLICKAGEVETWQDDGLTWIRASLENTPPWKHEELKFPDEVEKVDGFNKEHTMVWAWIDKSKGLVRARTFAPDWGIPEDQGNGSGSMQLASQLGQGLEIRHGKGSVIYAKPAGDKITDVGGRAKLDNPIEFVLVKPPLFCYYFSNQV